MSTRLLLCCALLATATIAVPASAFADPGDHAHPHVHDNPRLGFFGGLGLHAGEISCSGDTCGGVREAGGIDGHVGYAFNDKLAIVGEVWAMSGREENNFTISYINSSVGVRYWVAPILWLQAGLGSGHARVKYSGIIQAEGRSDNVATGMLAAGIEVLRSKRFALDVEVRIAQSASEDSDGNQVSTGRMTGLGVGFTWF